MQYTGTGVNGMSFTYWSWNPNSGDTGGIVGDDWVTVNQKKQSILQPYLIPPTGGGSTDPDPDPGETTACRVAWRLDSSWSGGFQGTLTITNTGTAAANPWRATFGLPSGATLGSGWNGTFSQSGSTVTVTAPSHAPSLAAGASVALGMTVNGTAATPAQVALSGTACTTS
jgi:endoglucanase